MKYHSIFISDFHLGMKNIDSNKLLSFLRNNDSKNLFLVGDIIDCWALKNKMYWPSINSEIVNEIYQKYLYGTKIFYTPGNHDEVFKVFDFNVINESHHFEMSDKFIYAALNGKKYLVTHGDIFDSVVNDAKWLAHLGSIGYDVLFSINIYLNKIRKVFKRDHWSLSQWTKSKIKSIVSFLDHYESCIITLLKQEGINGIICGHIHYPRISIIENMEYMNCGDFVESFSAIVEHTNGSFELLNLN